MTKPKNTNAAPARIAVNKKARHDYFIEDSFEAGLALEGWEVKSLRAGRAQLTESYVHVRNGEAWLLGAHISPLNTASTHIRPDPTRTRKLLLHRDWRGGAQGLYTGPAQPPLDPRTRKTRYRARQGQETARQTGNRERPGLAKTEGANSQVFEPVKTKAYLNYFI